MAAQTEVEDTEKQIVCKPANMKAPTMSTWNDDRLDEFSRRTDESFRKVDQRFEKVDQRFDKVDQEFKDVRAEIKEVRAEIHSLWGTLVIASFGIIGSIIGTGILT